MKIPCKIKDIKYGGEWAGEHGAIGDYYSDDDGIPARFIKHGSVRLHEHPDFTIVDKWEGFYIVSYRTSNDSQNYQERTQLGFREDQVIILDNDKPRGYTYGDKLKFTFNE